MGGPPGARSSPPLKNAIPPGFREGKGGSTLLSLLTPLPSSQAPQGQSHFHPRGRGSSRSGGTPSSQTRPPCHPPGPGGSGHSPRWRGQGANKRGGAAGAAGKFLNDSGPFHRLGFLACAIARGCAAGGAFRQHPLPTPHSRPRRQGRAGRLRPREGCELPKPHCEDRAGLSDAQAHAAGVPAAPSPTDGKPFKWGLWVPWASPPPCKASAGLCP